MKNQTDRHWTNRKAPFRMAQYTTQLIFVLSSILLNKQHTVQCWPKWLVQRSSWLDLPLGHPTQPIWTNFEIWANPNFGPGAPKNGQKLVWLLWSAKIVGSAFFDQNFLEPCRFGYFVPGKWPKPIILGVSNPDPTMIHSDPAVWGVQGDLWPQKGHFWQFLVTLAAYGAP